MKRIRFAKSAVSDLDEIWIFAAERDGIESAERIIDSLTRRLVMLLHNPKAGIARPDIGIGVRSFGFPPYRIYYRFDRSMIRVLYVRHGAQREP